MIKGLFFTAALLMPSLAYAANPSANLTVTVVHPSATIACDHGDPYVLQTGPGYTNGIPSGAYAAGQTHCAFHADFSKPFYTNRANWLDCAGAASPLLWNASINGSAYPPCDRISMTTDGGTQVVQLELQPGDRTYSIGTGLTTIEETYTSAGVDFPNAGYSQVTYRLTHDSLYNNPYGAHLSAWWSWSDTGQTQGGGFEERDNLEVYGNGPNYNDAGMPGYNGVGGCGRTCYFIIAGFGHPQFTLDPTAYHTIAGRITQDGSTNIAQCIYIDGVQQVCGDLLSAGQATGLSGLWNQRNYPIIDVDNPGSPLITTNIDAFVKEIVIFTCDGWAGPLNTPGHACNGPVLTGAP